MEKTKIIDLFLPLLSREGKMEYFKLSKNNYFGTHYSKAQKKLVDYIGPELLYQFFVTRLLDRHNINYVLLQNEGKQTTFERFTNILKGNKRGWSDLFIPKHKCFIELKSSSPFLANGKISNAKSAKHLQEQQLFLDIQRLAGYNAFFMYPEITFEMFYKYLGVRL